jgi:predicted house-cleaning noncanonical NTP pyrophosphatase (MazG superfamily)
MSSKLVRDNIPRICADKGEMQAFFIATEGVYRRALHEKLQEEVGEFYAARDDNRDNARVYELADIVEVCYALARLYKADDFEQVVSRRGYERGHFFKRIMLILPDEEATE